MQHLQASEFPGLACYWSSWHTAFRDSVDHQKYLGMDAEDKCLGYFIVAAHDELKDSRSRKRSTHMTVEWRE